MATVKDITTRCKNGQVQEAYTLAKSDYDSSPDNRWTHREMGWALYYLLKEDRDNGNFKNLLEHINIFNSLSLLSSPDDDILFNGILFNIASFIRNNIDINSFDAPAKLSTIFSKFRQYSFSPSNGYSFLLSQIIKFRNWKEMLDFLDWWNLSKLTAEDFNPIKLDNGKKIMSNAEQAYIAKARTLLLFNDQNKIKKFLPDMYELMTSHPEMIFLGYFYGKLLIALGNTSEESLNVILPFARKKVNEYWVWQLLSEVFVSQTDKQLACLLRAVHCHTDEKFLGKVRIKLAQILIDNKQLDYAKFQIEKVNECYNEQGWMLPKEIGSWLNETWINDVLSNDRSPLDFIKITNSILYEQIYEDIAVVTFVDQNSHKVFLVYGHEKRIAQKLKINVTIGSILKISYAIDDNKPFIINAKKTDLTSNLPYIKEIEGIIKKKKEWDFAFINYDSGNAFIAPAIVSKYNVSDGDRAKCLIVYDLDQKKNVWSWVCLTVRIIT